MSCHRCQRDNCPTQAWSCTPETHPECADTLDGMCGRWAQALADCHANSEDNPWRERALSAERKLGQYEGYDRAMLAIHSICQDAGVPVGYIVDRVEALAELYYKNKPCKGCRRKR